MDAISMPSSFSAAKSWAIDIYVLRDPCILYAYRMHQDGAADETGFVFSKQYGMGPHNNKNLYWGVVRGFTPL